MKLKREKYFQQLVKFNASVIIMCKQVTEQLGSLIKEQSKDKFRII